MLRDLGPYLSKPMRRILWKSFRINKREPHHKYEPIDYLSTVACCDSRNVESPERQAKNPLWGRI